MRGSHKALSPRRAVGPDDPEDSGWVFRLRDVFAYLQTLTLLGRPADTSDPASISNCPSTSLTSSDC